MQGWTVRTHGDVVDVLELAELADPVPGEHQVVIEVTAVALNFADSLLCSGTYQETPPLPFTPGLEVAGTVVAVGPDAVLALGTRVAGSAALPAGGLAQRCLADDADVFALPDSMPDLDAAAMHVTYQSAWFALFRRARLRERETILVHAGAGGVGSAAIQLAKAIGARVLATAGGPEKVALCRELGADEAIDYRSADVITSVLALTDGRGADVVFDPVGGPTYEASTRCVAWEGRILVIGAAGGEYAPARTNHVMVKNYSVIGLNWGGYRTRMPEMVRAAHDDLVRLHREGLIKPHIGRVVPLDAARDALVDLTARGTTGKVLVTP